MRKRQNITCLTVIVFGIYLALLVWLILFKLQTNPDMFVPMRALNFIPFVQFFESSGSVATMSTLFHEVWYNCLAFVPLGICLQIFLADWPLPKKIGLGLAVSVVFEVLQFVFSLGVSDITDVISNTIGCIIGLLICAVLARIFPRRCAWIVGITGITLEALVLVFAILFDSGIHI